MGLWWFMMVSYGFMMVLWWFYMVLYSFMMVLWWVYDGLWWFYMVLWWVYDGFPVGGAITILKNMSSTMGRIIPYMKWKIKSKKWNHQPDRDSVSCSGADFMFDVVSKRVRSTYSESSTFLNGLYPFSHSIPFINQKTASCPQLTPGNTGFGAFRLLKITLDPVEHGHGIFKMVEDSHSKILNGRL